MSWREFWRRASYDKLFITGGIIVLVLALFGGFANVISPYDPYEMHTSDRLASPSTQYLLGTDWAGRDTLSRLIYGSRITLFVSFSVVTLAGITGISLGLFAGYFGGGVDGVITALTNTVFAFPALVLALAVAVLLGPSTRNLILVLAILYTPNIIRITRGTVLVLREQVYIDAAVVVGSSSRRILFRHILPNVLPTALIQLTLGFSYTILSETSLTYLGFGAQPPDATWGTILNEGRPTIWESAWPSLFGGLFIGIAVLGFNLLGDGLRDILDPTLRHR